MADDNLLNLILAATNDGVMDWDLVAGTIEYSERWKSLLGYEAHELADSPSLWCDFSHPDDVANTVALLKDHTDNLWPFAHTWRMRHKSGDWRWTLCRAVTLQNDDGVSVRCVCVFTDVTDQVVAEQKLAELKRRNDILLTSAGEGFLGMDAGAAITFANPAALQLLGYAGMDLTGYRFAEVVRHRCQKDTVCNRVGCAILNPLADGQTHRATNVSFTRKDGSSFTADYVSTPAFDAGTTVGVVLTFRDVTEQRRLESQNMQGQKLEALGQLSAGIAHEINTPMQYIGDNVFFMGGAFSDLLALLAEHEAVMVAAREQADKSDPWERVVVARDAADIDYLKEAIPKAIASTQDGIERVRTLVSAMKAFSHPGHAEKSLEDLNHAVECTTVISGNTWKQVAQLEMKLDRDLPKVSCHLGEVNQVVLNLLVNAAHAIEDVRKGRDDGALGTITVETAVKNGFAEIRISDTGHGIPEAVRHRLFEPFFTTKEVGRGTGQGLTLARSMIVDRHNGYINFVTEMGKGTTFTIGLPLAAAP